MRFISTVLFTLISISSFAQLNIVDTSVDEEIGEIKNIHGKYFESFRKNDIYFIRYKDINYTKISEYKSFYMNKKSFDELYNLILKNWDNPPKDPIVIEFEDDFVWLDFKRALGITNLFIEHAPSHVSNSKGRSAVLTRKKVEKLFGK